MWQPRLLIRLGYRPTTTHSQHIKSRIQIATIRHVAYLENPKKRVPPKFQYKRPKPNAWGKGPQSPFDDGSIMWYPDTPVDRTCDELRRLINRLVDSREITIGDFQRMTKVSSTSYNCFMGQKGQWKGSKTATYARGLHYFQQREGAGVGISRKTAANTKVLRSKIKPAILSIDGQNLDSVPVYDTCHDIRRKINVYMRQFGVTPQAFLQDLSAQYCLTPTVIKKSDLETFRWAQGLHHGNTSSVYYAAYVFFEKIRVGLGKAKGKGRERIEALHGSENGLNVKTPWETYRDFLGPLPKGSRFTLENYGVSYIYTQGPPHSLMYYGQHEKPLTAEQARLYISWRLDDNLFQYNPSHVHHD